MMSVNIWVTNGYFDGERFFEDGPYTIAAVDGRIQSIIAGDFAGALSAEYLLSADADVGVDRVPFLMPGLVEAHAHLFLDGAELDTATRAAYLNAGDIHGINTAIKAEIQGRDCVPNIRSAGRAIRKNKRYGSFMAVEAADSAGIASVIDEIAPNADDIKVLMTGIIDFKTGQMAGSPQFNMHEARLIVSMARSCGKKTFTHCSGLDGLSIAVDAGMDSIEHGFFMNTDILERMADKQTAWVPTFSPVAFQRDRPELAGWDTDTVARLDVILDNHYRHLFKAHQLGVPIVAGSDAGSYGVPHGTGLVDELFHAEHAGIPVAANLASATSVPRRLWGCASANIQVGNRIDMIAVTGSPREKLDHVRNVVAVFRVPETVPVAV